MLTTRGWWDLGERRGEERNHGPLIWAIGLMEERLEVVPWCLKKPGQKTVIRVLQAGSVKAGVGAASQMRRMEPDKAVGETGLQSAAPQVHLCLAPSPAGELFPSTETS